MFENITNDFQGVFLLFQDFRKRYFIEIHDWFLRFETHWSRIRNESILVTFKDSPFQGYIQPESMRGHSESEEDVEIPEVIDGGNSAGSSVGRFGIENVQ